MPLANIGLPMILVIAPWAVILIVPIILIETYIAAKVLGIGFREPLRAVAIANVVSTVAGIPLTWLVLALVWMPLIGMLTEQLPKLDATQVVLTAPWLFPSPGMKYSSWMPILAALVLMPIFFVISVIVVRVLFEKAMDVDRAIAHRWSFRANAVTYGLIIVGLAIDLAARTYFS